MGAKNIMRVPFVAGSGVSRQYGAMMTEPGSFADLRNAHLTGDRMEIRRGLHLAADAGAPFTDILAIAPLRAVSQSVVVVYDEPTRQVRLLKVLIDPSSLEMTLTVVAGVLWTIPPTAQFPVVSITDSYGKAFIAHNEPLFSLRQLTMVYDPASGTFTSLKYNSGANPLVLRGITRWLTYLVGWGFGTDSVGPPDDRNRPESVRLSNPGDPEVWQPLFYFFAGQRGEPVIGCATSTAGLLIAKEGELHLITGTSQLDFDMLLVDPNFGAISERSMIEVNGQVFFWSAEGPRVSAGGPSVDLGLPLDLAGTVPDTVLASVDLRLCHATYRPDREEIEWIFPATGQGGAFSFTLDLKNPNKRNWSYRRYHRLIRCSGILAGNVTTDPGDPSLAAYVSLTSVTPQAGSIYQHTFTWANNNLSALPAGVRVELWAYSAPYSASTGFDGTQPAPNDPLGWVMLYNTPAAGASQTTVPLPFGTMAKSPFEYRAFAVRYRLADGTYYGHSASASPFDWPAVARKVIQGPLQPLPVNVALSLNAGSAPNERWNITWDNSNFANLDGGIEAEVWTLGSVNPGVPGGGIAWEQQLPNIVVGGANDTKSLVTITSPPDGTRRQVAVRFVLAGNYDPRYVSSDPWQWPVASRKGVIKDLVRAVNDTVFPDNSHVAWVFPNNAYAPTGTWYFEVWYRVRTPTSSGTWAQLDNFLLGSTPGPSGGRGIPTPTAGYFYDYAGRLMFNGVPYPSNYGGSNPSLWPADCIQVRPI